MRCTCSWAEQTFSARRWSARLTRSDRVKGSGAEQRAEPAKECSRLASTPASLLDKHLDAGDKHPDTKLPSRFTGAAVLPTARADVSQSVAALQPVTSALPHTLCKSAYWWLDSSITVLSILLCCTLSVSLLTGGWTVTLLCCPFYCAAQSL